MKPRGPAASSDPVFGKWPVALLDSRNANRALNGLRCAQKIQDRARAIDSVRQLLDRSLVGVAADFHRVGDIVRKDWDVLKAGRSGPRIDPSDHLYLNALDGYPLRRRLNQERVVEAGTEHAELQLRRELGPRS